MTAAVRRPYGELDRARVVASLHNLARRVGVRGVTMRDLAAELGAAVPSVYYHVPGKQAALDLLAESVLAEIPVPETGPWDSRLIELYCAAREVILAVPGRRGHTANQRRRRTRPPTRQAQPLPACRSRYSRKPLRRVSLGVVHLPAGFDKPGGIAPPPAHAQQTPGRQPFSGGTRRNHCRDQSLLTGRMVDR